MGTRSTITFIEKWGEEVTPITTVLDFCMGAGNCGIAAMNINRNFIGIELEKKYFDIAKDRIDKAKFPLDK